MPAKKKFQIFCLLFALCTITACGPSGKIFIKDEPIAVGYRHVADIEVHKKGFWLFWIIPLKAGCEPAAQEVMEEAALKSYPRTAGIYEYRVVDSYLPWFWISGTRVIGKIVVKQDQ